MRIEIENDENSEQKFSMLCESVSRRHLQRVCFVSGKLEIDWEVVVIVICSFLESSSVI